MLLNTAVKAVKMLSHRGDQAITVDQITTDIVACIMMARRDIISRLPKDWLKKSATVPLTCVPSTRPQCFDLATDVQDPIVFWYTVGTVVYKLKKVCSDYEWFSSVYNLSSSANKPYWYREIGPTTSQVKRIEIFPIPDIAYSINYEYFKTVATDMTTTDLNTEIPDIPTQNQDALQKGGLYYFLKSFDDPAQTQAEKDYQISLLQVDKSDQEDSDTALSFRFGVEYREPRGSNGMRIF